MSNEIVGYVAGLFIVISLLMSDIRMLRFLNMIGCILFVIYGFVVHAYPVMVLNIAAILINIYYIVKLRTSQKKSSIVKSK